MVRVTAVQTGLRGAIVASEQTDDFEKGPEGLWLLARSDTRQMYEGAAHRTPIHRLLVLDRAPGRTRRISRRGAGPLTHRTR